MTWTWPDVILARYLGDIWRVDAVKTWNDGEIPLKDYRSDLFAVQSFKLTWLYGSRVHPEIRLAGAYARPDQATPLTEMKVVALFATEGFPTDKALGHVADG